MTLQNEGAWGALAAAKPAEVKEAAKPADGSAGAGGSGPGSSAPGEQDPLWSEFASREQQQRKREAEKAAEEDKRRAEKAKVRRAAATDYCMVCTRVADSAKVHCDMIDSTSRSLHEGDFSVRAACGRVLALPDGERAMCAGGGGCAK